MSISPMMINAAARYMLIGAGCGAGLGICSSSGRAQTKKEILFGVITGLAMFAIKMLVHTTAAHWAFAGCVIAGAWSILANNQGVGSDDFNQARIVGFLVGTAASMVLFGF